MVVERVYSTGVGQLWDLWTTKAGFESWWGPEGFCADVHAIEPRLGGGLHYTMRAATPEMVKAMEQMGRPAAHEGHARFSEYQPHARLALTHVIDFLPGVAPYDNTMTVEFSPAGDGARMVVTFSPMHDEEFTKMSQIGFASQLSKLDKQFGWSGE